MSMGAGTIPGSTIMRSSPSRTKPNGARDVRPTIGDVSSEQDLVLSRHGLFVGAVSLSDQQPPGGIRRERRLRYKTASIFCRRLALG